MRLHMMKSLLVAVVTRDSNGCLQSPDEIRIQATLGSTAVYFHSSSLWNGSYYSSVPLNCFKSPQKPVPARLKVGKRGWELEGVVHKW